MHICTHAHTHIYIYIYIFTLLYPTIPHSSKAQVIDQCRAWVHGHQQRCCRRDRRGPRADEVSFLVVVLVSEAMVSNQETLAKWTGWTGLNGWTLKSNYPKRGWGIWLDLLAGKSTKIGSNKEIQPMQPILIHAGCWYEFESYKADFGSAKSSRAIQRLQLVRSQLNKHLRNYPWDSFSNKYQ